ncbi:mitochondrial fission 1 protein-like isoform X2 [Pomacea canaliculata]|uniref:mitochondrial fission 1 protein-like isoform X2 n=1 Tax=Pomacea canaliculata TaxID=400727 RepID=UPI000D734DBB|nr:mitochondrial fission 1 protein-like isoform X2 [Pomacea canaliculata]XP_025080235.1 mitochondrial fission 1 protein-like isoform X2 [Pomacea canaliculata]XP_025080236.1 mitochondrial fission 1 protein-like isoform X2 [Pomacea canaliculata]
MESVIEDNIDPGDLKKFELMYNDQYRRGHVAEKTQFDYAWCLIRSRYVEDMKRGVSLLDDLLRTAKDDMSKRDYLYYIAVGYTRLKDYERALKYVDAIRHIEPSNHQARQLHNYIKKKMEKDGLMGMAIVGGAALALGGLVGLGIAVLKK